MTEIELTPFCATGCPDRICRVELGECAWRVAGAGQLELDDNPDDGGRNRFARWLPIRAKTDGGEPVL